MAYKIAILVGSLRDASINRKVARSMCAMQGDGLDCSMVEIGDLPLYNQEYDGEPPQEYVRFRDEIREVDGVLFVSPEYNREHSRSPEERDRHRLAPVRKERVERKAGSDHHRLAGIDRRLRSQSPDPPGCVFLNMPVMQQPEAYLGNVSDDSFDEDGCLKDGFAQEADRKARPRLPRLGRHDPPLARGCWPGLCEKGEGARGAAEGESVDV
jgi:chromate reductase, NAD(P)H dehydrogenase (quinone)